MTKITRAAAFALAASYAWGSNAACSTSPSYTQATSYGSGTTAGCYVLDKTFSAFSELAVGTGDFYLAGGQSGYTNGFGSYSASVQFTASATGDPWIVSENGLLNNQLNFIVDSANTYGFDSTYPTQPSASLITSVSLSGADGAGTGGGLIQVEVVEEFCIGAGGCNFAQTNSIELTLTDSGSGLLGDCHIFGHVAGATCLSNQASVTFSDVVTSLSVYSSYQLIAPSTNGLVALDYFEDTFGEDGITPEPSTFVLMGSALAGLAALRLRKRS